MCGDGIHVRWASEHFKRAWLILAVGFVSRLSNIKQSWDKDTAKRHILKDIPRFPYLFFSLYASFSAFYIPPSCYCLHLFSASLSRLCKLFPFPITLSFLSLFISLSLSLSESDWERHSVWIAASRSRLSPPADSTGLICLLFIKQIRRRGNENIIAIWFPARYFAYWFRADSGISSSHFFFFSCFKNWITELGGFGRISLHCWEEGGGKKTQKRQKQFPRKTT